MMRADISTVHQLANFALVGQFVGGSARPGHVIPIAQGQFDTVRVFAALVVLGMIGMVLFYGVEAAERLTLPRHVSQRSQSAR